MNQELSELRKKPHWSFSSLNGFINICSLQWAFRYIYNIESEITPVSLLFGTAFHKTASWLATLRQQNVYAMSEEAQEVFSEAWKIECKAAPNLNLPDSEFNELNATGRKMIDCFSRKWIEDNIIAVSKAFSVQIPGSQLPLIGELDLVIKNDSGKHVLIDWKTAERKWPDGKADKDLQATCFMYADQELNKSSRKGRSLFRYDVVTKAKDPTYTQHYTYRTEDDFQRLFRLIQIVEKAIAAEAFLPNETSFYCNGCQYSSACKSWHCQKAKTISTPIAA